MSQKINATSLELSVKALPKSGLVVEHNDEVELLIVDQKSGSVCVISYLYKSGAQKFKLLYRASPDLKIMRLKSGAIKEALDSLDKSDPF